MKKLFFVMMLFIASYGIKFTFAQEPEPVYSILKQLKPYEWYVKQAGLWKQEIRNDSANATAWYNYYIANRMAGMTRKPANLKSSDENVFQDFNQIIASMEKSIPESFEYNYVKWWGGGLNLELFPYLEKAHALDPGRHEVYDDFISYYEVKRNTHEVNKYCHLWYKSSDISPGILTLNYNILMSLEKDAIIFTAGDNDTYPIWILQYVKNIRKDVVVLNTSLIFIEEYSKAIFQELKIPAFEKTPGDFVTKEIKKSGNYQLAYNAYQKALVWHIVENSDQRPTYFAVTCRKSLYSEYEDKLYIEGLAFKYSQEGYDNLAILRRNVEQKFFLDYLTVDLSNDFSLSVVNQTNFNYIVPFINLHDHYKLSGEIEKASNIRALALKVAERAGRESEIKKQFAE